jgi:hypothetical protein
LLIGKEAEKNVIKYCYMSKNLAQTLKALQQGSCWLKRPSMRFPGEYASCDEPALEVQRAKNARAALVGVCGI